MDRVAYEGVGVLGFGTLSVMNGCMEYGCPTRDFSYSGRVTTEAGEPIEGVRSVIAYKERREVRDTIAGNDTAEVKECEYYWQGKDTMWSDDDGRFRSEVYKEPVMYPVDAILLEDVDGEANGGSFESDTVRLSDMQETKVKRGDGRWYEGEFEYSFERRLREKRDGE